MAGITVGRVGQCGEPACFLTGTPAHPPPSHAVSSAPGRPHISAYHTSLLLLLFYLDHTAVQPLSGCGASVGSSIITGSPGMGA